MPWGMDELPVRTRLRISEPGGQHTVARWWSSRGRPEETDYRRFRVGEEGRPGPDDLPRWRRCWAGESRSTGSRRTFLRMTGDRATKAATLPSDSDRRR